LLSANHGVASCGPVADGPGSGQDIMTSMTRSEATAASPRGSPRSRARDMIQKSASIRMLEEEGGLMQTEFLDRSQSKDHVSLSCLTAIKNLTETGRFGEAQDELEQVVMRTKAPREHGMACLLLAELFNKWGAASASYTIDIMESGACTHTHTHTHTHT
jgi:hypothetical protein